MNFLFLTNTRHLDRPWLDASTRYRCYHLAEALIDLGHRADVAALATFKPAQLTAYDVLVILRPPDTRHVHELLKTCEKQGLVSVADYDDLIFAPALADHAPLVQNGSATPAEATRQFQANLSVMQAFSLVTVATGALQLQAQALSGNVTGKPVANGLSRRWLRLNGHLGPKPYGHPGQCNISYLPGSRSHDQDFRQIAGTLEQWLVKNPDYRLEITGPLNLPTDGIDPTLIRQRPLVPFDELPEIIGRTGVCIAPLVNNAFNRCKSHIKFIESAAFGTPVIATAIPDIARHQVDGLFAVENREQWLHSLELLQQPDYYAHCSHSVHDYVRQHCMSHRSALQLIENLDTGDRMASEPTSTAA